MDLISKVFIHYLDLIAEYYRKGGKDRANR